MKIEAISVDIFHRELAQAPGLLLERIYNSRAQRTQFLMGRVYIRRKYPVHGGFERTYPFAKENHDVVSRDGTDLSSGVKPANCETERVAVMPLSSFHVFNRKLRCGMAECHSQIRSVHLLLALAPGLASGERERMSSRYRSRIRSTLMARLRAVRGVESPMCSVSVAARNSTISWEDPSLVSSE